MPAVTHAPASGVMATDRARPAWLGTRSIVATLFVVGCLVRFATVWVGSHGAYDPRVSLRGDAEAYAAVAVSVARGEGYSYHYMPVLARFFADPAHVRPTTPPTPSAYKRPGYPLFLAGVFWLSGFRLDAVLYVQALVSALAALLVYLIGREVASPRAAMLAYLFTLFYYPLWYENVVFLTENLQIVLTVLALYGLVRWVAAPSPLTAAWIGVTIGADFLVKPVILLFMPVFVALLWWQRRSLGTVKPYLVAGAVMAAFAVLVVAPWGIRNYRHSGELLLSGSDSGKYLNLIYNRHNVDFAVYHDPGYYDENLPALLALYDQLRIDIPPGTPPMLAEELQDRVYLKAALRFMAGHPWQVIRTWPHNVWNMWRVDYPSARIYRKASNWTLSVGLLPCFVLGVVLAVRRRPTRLLVPVAFVLFYVAFHALNASIIRYRIVVMPVYFVVAAVGVDAVLGWLGWAWGRS